MPDVTTFNTAEPRTKLIALFGVGTILILIAIILALQAYVDRVRDQEVFVKVLEPVSTDLKALRAREDAELNTYHYIDRGKGVVRLPISRAMDLRLKEAHAATER